MTTTTETRIVNLGAKEYDMITREQERKLFFEHDYNAIIKANLRYIRNLAQQLDYTHNDAIVNDLISVGVITMHDMLPVYNPDKARVITFCSAYMKGRMLIALRQHHSVLTLPPKPTMKVEVVNIADVDGLQIPSGDEPEVNFDVNLKADVIKKAIDKLTPQQSDVINMLFFQGLTREETADKLQISPSRVSQIKTDALSSLGQDNNIISMEDYYE